MKLKQAIELLENAVAVILPDEPGSPLMYPSLDKDSDAFMSLNWTDEDGIGFGIVFLKEHNGEVMETVNALIFEDEDRNEIAVQLLVPQTFQNNI